jgi:hypothetical protein
MISLIESSPGMKNATKLAMGARFRVNPATNLRDLRSLDATKPEF